MPPLPTASSLTLSAIALTLLLPSLLLPTLAAQDSKKSAVKPLWLDDFVAAEAEARQSRRPILVYAFDSI